ncbi:hypothetical protein [Paraliobacillus ryukyuensis]|uniref:hypothetical protein n=1 Tax=Paraliobacillus ryukyuensis TaxID=200904 RepID=UPI0009A5F1D0|nr:hypothetical protein [Paraliobacillus ryukyuensis]
MKLTSRRNFFIIGIVFVLIFVSRTFIGIYTDSLSIIEIFMWGTLSYLCFTGGYLFPQFKHKDERTQLIKQKGMYYSLLAVLFYFIILLLLNNFNILNLRIIEAVQIILGLTIITIFSSWVILSKKY